MIDEKTLIAALEASKTCGGGGKYCKGPSPHEFHDYAASLRPIIIRRKVCPAFYTVVVNEGYKPADIWPFLNGAYL